MTFHHKKMSCAIKETPILGKIFAFLGAFFFTKKRIFCGLYNYNISPFTNVTFPQVFHTIGISLTMTLAVWRYLAVYKAALSREWCTARGTKIAITAALIGSLLICTPILLAFSVIEHVDENGDTIFFVDLSDLARHANGFLINANFWFYNIGLKLLTCILLGVMCQRLIAALQKIQNRRRSLPGEAEIKDGMYSSSFLLAFWYNLEATYSVKDGM
jgi:hypothetical protein